MLLQQVQLKQPGNERAAGLYHLQPLTVHHVNTQILPSRLEKHEGKSVQMRDVAHSEIITFTF